MSTWNGAVRPGRSLLQGLSGCLTGRCGLHLPLQFLTLEAAAGLRPTECVALTCSSWDGGVRIKNLNSVFRASSRLLRNWFLTPLPCLHLSTSWEERVESGEGKDHHIDKALGRLLCLGFSLDSEEKLSKCCFSFCLWVHLERSFRETGEGRAAQGPTTDPTMFSDGRASRTLPTPVGAHTSAHTSPSLWLSGRRTSLGVPGQVSGRCANPLKLYVSFFPREGSNDFCWLQKIKTYWRSYYEIMNGPTSCLLLSLWLGKLFC